MCVLAVILSVSRFHTCLLFILHEMNKICVLKPLFQRFHMSQGQRPNCKSCLLFSLSIRTSYWILFSGCSLRGNDLLVLFVHFGGFRPTQEFFTHDITITGKGLQILTLCSAPTAIEQWGFFSVPHLLAVTRGISL